MSEQFNTTITNAIAAVDAELESVKAELERLTSGRATLESLLTESAPSDKPAKKSKAKTEQAAKQSQSRKADTQSPGGESTVRERIVAMLNNGDKPSDIAKAIGHSTPSYVYSVKKSLPKGGNRSKRNTTSGNGNGNSGHSTKREHIEALLSEGHSPKEVAQMTGAHQAYVYSVKNA